MMFLTWKTSMPWYSRTRRIRSASRYDAQVADVGVPVHGRAAGVHPDPARLQRLDRLDPAGQRVAEVEGHGPIVARGLRTHRETRKSSAEALTRPGITRYRSRGLAEQTSFPRRCGPARPHLPCPPAGIARILRAMRRRILSLLVIVLLGACSPQAVGDHGRDARILLGPPTTLDPAASGDAGSAAYTAQFFETLTAFDTALELRPRSPSRGGSRTAAGASSSTCDRTSRSPTAVRCGPPTSCAAGCA